MKKLVVFTVLFLAIVIRVTPASAQEASCARYVEKASPDLQTYMAARCESDAKKIDNAIAHAIELPKQLQVTIAGLSANENLSETQKAKLKAIRIEIMDQKIQDYVRLKLGLVTAAR